MEPITAKQAGAIGGKTRARLLSKEKRREIAQKAGKESARLRKLGIRSPLQVKKNETPIKTAILKLYSAVLSSMISKLTTHRDNVDAILSPQKKRRLKRIATQKLLTSTTLPIQNIE
jgi:hypothetical protein